MKTCSNWQLAQRVAIFRVCPDCPGKCDRVTQTGRGRDCLQRPPPVRLATLSLPMLHSVDRYSEGQSRASKPRRGLGRCHSSRVNHRSSRSGTSNIEKTTFVHGGKPVSVVQSGPRGGGRATGWIARLFQREKCYRLHHWAGERSTCQTGLVANPVS